MAPGRVVLALPLHHPQIEQCVRILRVRLQHLLQLLESSIHVSAVIKTGGELRTGAEILGVRLERLAIILG